MQTKKLVNSSILIAIAAMLSLIHPVSLPFGGDITIASSAPIIIIAYIYGVKWGTLSAFVFSIIQMLMGGSTISAMFMPGDGQMLLWQALCVCLIEYIFAYSILGFGGIFKNKFKSSAAAICAGSVFTLSLRYLLHIISGAIFYGAWAEWFFTQEGFYSIGKIILERFSGNALAIVYSVFYNGLYMLPEIIITAVVTPIIYKVIEKNMKN